MRTKPVLRYNWIWNWIKNMLVTLVESNYMYLPPLDNVITESNNTPSDGNGNDSLTNVNSKINKLYFLDM